MKLGDICYINSGCTPSRSILKYYQGTIPWAKISDIENAKNGIILDTVEKISADGLKSIRNKIFPKGTLLFAMYGSIGKMAFAGKELSTNQAILGIRPKNDKQLHLQYLRIWLERNKQKLINQGRGVALKNLSATMIRDIEIALPPIDEQIRIATILSRVETIIAKRKESIRLLDELLKSTFIEMFGPSAENFEGWPLTEIQKLAANKKGSMRTGPFGSNLLHSEFSEKGDVAVLGIDNAVDNRFKWKEKRFITLEKYEILKNYKIFPRDVLITIMGTTGRSSVVPDSIPIAITTKHLAVITLDEKKANPYFISYSIHSSPFVKAQLLSRNRGAIMSGLNLGIIKKIKIKKPPVELQNQFVNILDKVEFIKSKYETSLQELKNLYGSLSQQAFKGELDLNRIPITKKIELRDTINMSDMVEINVVKKLTKFSPKALKELIKEKFETHFSFEALMEELENASFKSMPEYKEIKNQVFKLLEGKTPMLPQAFDMDKKEMMLTVNP